MTTVASIMAKAQKDVAAIMAKAQKDVAALEAKEAKASPKGKASPKAKTSPAKSKAKAAPKAKADDDSLEAKVIAAIEKAGTATQSYYCVDTGKTVTRRGAAKTANIFYSKGEIHVCGSSAAKLRKPLSELGLTAADKVTDEAKPKAKGKAPAKKGKAEAEDADDEAEDEDEVEDEDDEAEDETADEDDE